MQLVAATLEDEQIGTGVDQCPSLLGHHVDGRVTVVGRVVLARGGHAAAIAAPPGRHLDSGFTFGHRGESVEHGLQCRDIRVRTSGGLRSILDDAGWTAASSLTWIPAIVITPQTGTYFETTARQT